MTDDVLRSLGWTEHWQKAYENASPSTEALPGRIIRHDGVAVMVTTPAGTEQVAIRRSDPPLVGDWAVVENSAVVKVLERTSLLARKDPRADIEQPLAANLDAVLIVVPLDRPVHQGIVRKAVALVNSSGAEPVIVLTKSDTSDETDEAVAETQRQQNDVEVLTFSKHSTDDIQRLRKWVSDRTLVLLGESGAGKSSLTNALIGDEVAETGGVRERDAQGRHTTSSRQLHVLPSGGVLIDTPGIRKFTILNGEDAVEATFDDIQEIAEHCRFGDCKHGNEPGCAVRAAIADGELDDKRVEEWRAMQNEAEATAERLLQEEYRNKRRSRTS